MSKEHEYILTSEGELYHYGVKGMKWGTRKNPTEVLIGQNHTTPANESSSSSSGGGGGAPEEEDEKEFDMLELTKKADRLLETTKVWLNGKLSMNVIDTITGKTKSMSWQQAKDWVDYTYRFADEQHR